MPRFEVVATNTQMKSTLDRRNLAMDSTLDSLPLLKAILEYMRPIPTATKGSTAPDFSLRGSRDPGPNILPFPRGLITGQKNQLLSPSASRAVHTEIKTMSSVSANIVLISRRFTLCTPTLQGEALDSEGKRSENDFPRFQDRGVTH